ncbi:DNA- binding [Tyrophagus putrescentiae]|nr:DNA- binding [Tyrophagus putrescentiae]
MPWVTDITNKDAVPIFVPESAVIGHAIPQPPPPPPPDTPGPSNASNAPGRLPASLATVVTAPGPSITIPTNSLTNGPQRILCIPVQWKRIKYPQLNSVYYVSPSGHVLLSQEDVEQYLKGQFTCKCFLKLSLKVDEMFDFNFEVNHINAKYPEQGATNRCEIWSQNLPQNYLHAQMLLALDCLSSQEVADLRQVHRIRHTLPDGTLLASYDPDNFYAWLGTFPWSEVRVTRDGRMLAYHLSLQQMVHLTYELSASKELNKGGKLARVATTAARHTSAAAQILFSCRCRPLHRRLQPPSSSSSSTPTLATKPPPQPKPVKVYQRRRPPPQPKPPKPPAASKTQPKRPKITTPPIAVGQQHLQQPSHLVQHTFQLQTNTQPPIKIGNTVTSSIPASLAVGFKSVPAVQKGGGGPAAARRKAPAQGKAVPAAAVAGVSLPNQPVMIVSNAPTNSTTTTTTSSSLAAAVAQYQQKQQQLHSLISPQTNVGPPPPPPQHHHHHQPLEIPKGCKPELIFVKDGQVSTHHLVMNGHGKHREFAPSSAAAVLPTFNLPGCSTASFSTASTSSSFSYTPTPVNRTPIDMNSARVLMAELATAKQQLAEAKAEQMSRTMAAYQQSAAILNAPASSGSSSSSSSKKPPARRTARKTRLTKAQTAAKEQLELAAASELRKQNELAATRQSASSSSSSSSSHLPEHLQAVAKLMNTPKRTKQEDSGHLRRPISPLSSLPRFESSFQTKANRLITAEPLKPLPTIDTLMAPNRALKYIQILTPPTVGTLVQSAVSATTMTMTITTTTISAGAATAFSSVSVRPGISALATVTASSSATGSNSSGGGGFSQFSVSTTTTTTTTSAAAAVIARLPPETTIVPIEPTRSAKGAVLRIKHSSSNISTSISTTSISSGNNSSSNSSSFSQPQQQQPPPPTFSQQLPPLPERLQPQRPQPPLFTYQRQVQYSFDNGRLLGPQQQQQKQPQQQQPPPQLPPSSSSSSSSSTRTFEPYEMVLDPPVNRLDFAASLLELGNRAFASNTAVPPQPAPASVSVRAAPFIPQTRAAAISTEENNNNTIEPFTDTAPAALAPPFQQLPSSQPFTLPEKPEQRVDMSAAVFVDDAKKAAALDLPTAVASSTNETTGIEVNREMAVVEECESMRSEAIISVTSEPTHPVTTLEYDSHEELQFNKEPEEPEQEVQEMRVEDDEPPQSAVPEVKTVSPLQQQSQSSSDSFGEKESVPEGADAEAEKDLKKDGAANLLETPSLEEEEDPQPPTESVVDNADPTVLPMEESTDSSYEENPTAAAPNTEIEETNLSEATEVAASPPPQPITEKNQQPLEGDSAMQVEYGGEESVSNEVLREGDSTLGAPVEKEEEKQNSDKCYDSVMEEPCQKDLPMEEVNGKNRGEQVMGVQENGPEEKEEVVVENERDAMNSYVNSLSSLGEPESAAHRMQMNEESDDDDDSEEEEELLNSSREQETLGYEDEDEENDGREEAMQEEVEEEDEDEEDEDEEEEIDANPPAFSKVFSNSSSFSPPIIVASGSSDKTATTNCVASMPTPPRSGSHGKFSSLAFLTIPELSASSSPLPQPFSAETSAATQPVASPSASSSTSPPTSPPASPVEAAVNEETKGTTTNAVPPEIEPQQEEEEEEEEQSLMEEDQSTTTSTSAVSSPFEPPPPDSPLGPSTSATASTNIATVTNITAGAEKLQHRSLITRTSSPDSPASRGSRTSSRTSRASSRASMTASPSTLVRAVRTVRPSRTTRSSRSSFLVSRPERNSRSSSSSQSSSRSSSPRNLTVTVAASAASSSNASSAAAKATAPNDVVAGSGRHRHNSSGGGGGGNGANTDEGEDGEGDDEQRRQRRMDRLKKELEFQGRPPKDNSESEEKDRMSPPLPPQERHFKIGDIVFGQRGDVRYWPGKVVSYGRSTRVDRAVPLDAKVTVLWYGKSVSQEKETLMTVSTLLTLTEGLEEHHRMKKRTRSGSYKRMNRELEDAIQEAVGWCEPEVLTSSSET